jgi:hypothetical protein
MTEGKQQSPGIRWIVGVERHRLAGLDTSTLWHVSETNVIKHTSPLFSRYFTDINVVPRVSKARSTSTTRSFLVDAGLSSTKS